MKYTAIVPARSGSKRLPNKNVMELAGKPLLVWTLEACAMCAEIDKVILSTDSMEYFEIASKYIDRDKLVLDYRNVSEAGDKVKIFDYLKEKRKKIFDEYDEAFILALPTAPLRKAGHISEAIALFEKKKVAVFSAAPYDFPISFAFHVSDNGDWKPVFNDNPMLTGNTRSQDQKDYLRPNGAIYIRPVIDLENKELHSLYQDAIPYLMGLHDSIDIDSIIDFKIAESLS